MYAEVIIPRAVKAFNKIYHYSIPTELVEKVVVGAQVAVPFGRNRVLGYVVGLVEKAEVEQVKDISEVISLFPLFDEDSVKLAKWIADYYLCYLYSALALFLPVGKGRRVEGALGQRVEKIQAAPSLNAAQEEAGKQIRGAIEKKEKAVFLLHGVTGSGKTEVYMRATEDVLKQNKSAIILVPEIALIPQLVDRFFQRFGNNISILHSGMTDKKRREAWESIADGKSKIVIGTRLALFAPAKEIGLIILDEEYENSYKSEASPRYNSREVALKLAGLKKAVVVLGSATPSLETYYHAESGEFTKLKLPERIDNKPLPPVQVINMAEEAKLRNRGIFSRKLREEIEGCLARKEQVILFVNRRGHFTFARCEACKKTIECPKCSVSLAYYSSDRRLHCHMCGYSVPENIICPHCEDARINLFGIGTERIEEEIKKYFPKARLLRIDGGITNKKKDHDKNHQLLVDRNVDILIGTQMIAKGLDLPGVTLVGVVSADSMLYSDDFRSSERTFQLLTQVSGRAGRGNIPGKVIVQTNNPEHYAIQSAAKHDYAAFYSNEIKQRRELKYPPFSNLIGIVYSSKDKEKAFGASRQMKEALKNGGFEVMGPIVAALAKKRDEWRFQLLVKKFDQQKNISEILSGIEVPYGIKCVVDVDPL